MPQLRQRTRQIAGLLGFPTRQQAEVAAGVAAYASHLLNLSGGVLVEFQVDDDPAGQRLLVAMEFEGCPGEEIEGPGTAMVEQVELRPGAGGRTTLLLAREFPAEAPAAPGEALARIAGELAKRGGPRGATLDAHVTSDVEPADATGELCRVHRELQGYASAVSQDLKAPLTEMLLAGETLGEKLAERGREACDAGLRMLLEAIRENVEQSVNLMDDLLALSEAGQAPAEVTEVSVGRTIEAVVRERGLLLEQRKARVEAGEDLGTVRASPTHVFHVFSNLVGNLIRNNDCPDPVVEILRLPSEGGAATFLVRDNGPGMPREDMDTLFNPFFKGSTGKMGAGLAIVDLIVRLYGGTIEAFNDGGTCFRFRWPGFKPSPAAGEKL